MSDLDDVFGIGIGENNPYLSIGFPRNPFKSDGVRPEGLRPFYTGHIKSELRQIQEWLSQVVDGSSYSPLSIVGTIGTGKSKILRVLKAQITRSSSRRVLCDIVLLTGTGYSRASIGGVLLSSLETLRFPGWTHSPDGVMPLIWAIVQKGGAVPTRRNPFIDSLLVISDIPEESLKLEMARDVSLWLRRGTLSAKRAEQIGLPRKIDWEGELIHIAASLIRLSYDWRVLDAYFFFVDQLEDLFGPAFTDVRRSRLLTDLRSLIDEIDEGTPIGMVLSWSPEFRITPYSINVESELSRRYAALYDRIRRFRVDIPYLTQSDALPLAKEYIDTLADQPGFDERQQPSIDDLVDEAWRRSESRRELIPGNRTTPRTLLASLANVTDTRAGVIPESSEDR